MKTSDFDYKLPESLIAHTPVKRRDHSRLLVIDRNKHSLQHKHFYDIIDYLNPGDLLVLNDTKVIPARMIGRKEAGSAKIEVFLVNQTSDSMTWKCLVKPGKRLKVGSKVVFGKGKLVGTVLKKIETGEQIIHFKCKGNFWKIIAKLGKVPLPPYIKKANKRERYQTVYADKLGASAAPTAGLHFTNSLLRKIKKKGVKIAYITLHTGLGTFLPVRTENIKDHKMHLEYYEIPMKTVNAIKKAKRVIAVGTTSVRALESSRVPRYSSQTDLFIYPDYKFKVIDAMITNFHWPKSSLIMLVSAFAGKDFMMEAYQEAIKRKYRFFSFGDAMLIL